MTFKIAGAQMDIDIGDAEANLASMQRLATTATENGAELVVFPECTLTGYCFDTFEDALAVSQPLSGDLVPRVVAMASQLQTRILFGMLELDDTGAKPKIYNVVVLVDQTGIIASYRKTHLPTLGVDRFTTPGDSATEIVRLPEINLGMNICIGSEHGFDFVGKSKICDPLGGELAFANHADEAILYGDVDVSWARKKHYVSVPGKHEVHRFDDRRPDLYGPLSD